jgi:hypothetical protein
MRSLDAGFAIVEDGVYGIVVLDSMDHLLTTDMAG